VPLSPASFASNQPPTAKQLNTALYTYTPGSNFTPNGILFHANRPILVEGLQASISQASSTAGALTPLNGASNWKNYFDNTTLFGGGADTQYDTANGSFNPVVPGSSGAAGTAGGNFIIWGFPAFASTTNPRGAGAYLQIAGTNIQGGKQFSSNAHVNTSYALDMVSAYQGQETILQGWCADTSGNSYAYQVNTQDYSGIGTRFYGFWGGVLLNGSTVSSVPSPPAWTSTSTVSSSALNNSAVGTPLTLLNNPPALRIGQSVSGTATTSLSTIPFTATPQVDTYSAWNKTSAVYTVPLSGVYLVHGLVSYSTSTTFNVTAVIYINSTTQLSGPSYQGTSGILIDCQVVRLVDLHAGDTVQLATVATGTQTLGTDPCRLVMLWMAALGSSNDSLSFTPPDTGYRWQAGTSGTALTAAFQTHLTNDVSFLINRPYLLAYQGTAQTGLSQNAFHTITMDTVGGLVHGSAGDPYGGWNTGSGGYYAAQVDGWYLVIAGYTQSALASGTASCVAGILQSPAGSTTPDYYQRISTTTTSGTPGAEAVGIYYLRAGDTVQPQYEQLTGGVTFSTVVTSGHQSSFSLVWLSE
jgi:hypothetical protein